jgi:hypothetical protein
MTRNGKKLANAAGNGLAQVRMLEVDMSELERQLARAYADVRQRDQERKACTEAYKEAQSALGALVEEFARRVNGENPLPFAPAVSEVKPEVLDVDEDEDLEDDVDDDSIQDGEEAEEIDTQTGATVGVLTRAAAFEGPE